MSDLWSVDISSTVRLTIAISIEGLYPVAIITFSQVSSLSFVVNLEADSNILVGKRLADKLSKIMAATWWILYTYTCNIILFTPL